MSELNIAVWGLGNHALNRILPVIDAFDGLNLLGVCSRNEKSVKRSADKWNCIGWVNIDEMLNYPSLDIIYIASPIGLHFQMTEKALNAGKHVWCEKPLSCDLKETMALLDLASEKNRVITETFMYLHHPQYKRVRKFVDESQDVNSIICRFGIPDLISPGFRNNPKLCGGSFWDVGSYTTSAVLGIYPNQKVEVLFSEIIQNKNSIVDSSGRALLRFSNGVTTYLEWAAGVAYKNEIDIWSKDGCLFTNKIFSKSSDYAPKFYFRDSNGKIKIEQGENTEQFREMFHYFLEIMDNESMNNFEREAILQRAKLLDEIFTF
jgi:predicted dehydrogenase